MLLIEDLVILIKYYFNILPSNGASAKSWEKGSLPLSPAVGCDRRPQRFHNPAAQRNQRAQHPRPAPPPLPQRQRTRRTSLQLAIFLLLHQRGRQKVFVWLPQPYRRGRASHLEVFGFLARKDEKRQYEHIIEDKGRKIRREVKDRPEGERRGGRGGPRGDRERREKKE